MNSRDFAALVAAALFGSTSIAAAQQAPIIQPGAPGEDVRELSPKDAIEIADSSYTQDDVRFMQDMIPHHHQAIQMAELVAERTNLPELIDVAGRINATQEDEIRFMQDWLRERGEEATDPTAHHAMHTTHEMAGMASPEEMKTLAMSKDTAFDRLFLSLMIAHHDGAVTMVEDLFERPGSAHDPILFEFATDVANDQAAEIERMDALLISLSADPRANLKAGLYDAGQAISNLNLVTSLPRPDGFFDPNNPLEMSSGYLYPEEEADDAEAADADEDEDAEVDPGRSAMMSFTQTDIAFRDDVMVVGNYHGFNTYRLQEDGTPMHLGSVVCPGGQGDVSIVGDILIMSAQETRGRLDCGLEGVADDVSEERFRGVRIFDISNLARPRQVGAVQTCRGSHTHSVVSGPGDDGKIIVYNSGTSSIRPEEELEGCYDESPGDDRTALFRIDVIEIPVDDPSKARIVDSPTVFADPEVGRLAGLWVGGDHGEGTQETNITDHCHDITVFPSLNIAGGACSGNGIIFDISDPMSPQRIDEVVDVGFAYWHSATFNNDGTKVLFTDEWGGGSRPRCRSFDPLTWGANAIYDIVDNQLEFRSYYKMPAPQGEYENCVAHNGSIVPVPGRDIFVQAWYQGGVSILDFTDSENPVEIAYFDRGPLTDEYPVFGGYWSVYWYNGKVYGTETMRGLDVLELIPSDYLTANEIAAAEAADYDGIFNPQQQFPVKWPDEPVVARAYIDQLNRDQALPAELNDNLTAALAGAETALADGGKDRGLSRTLGRLAKEVDAGSADNQTAKRQAALSSTLNGIAKRLR